MRSTICLRLLQAPPAHHPALALETCLANQLLPASPARSFDNRGEFSIMKGFIEDLNLVPLFDANATTTFVANDTAYEEPILDNLVLDSLKMQEKFNFVSDARPVGLPCAKLVGALSECPVLSAVYLTVLGAEMPGVPLF